MTKAESEPRATPSRECIFAAKSAKSAKYPVFCGYTCKNPGYTRVIPALLHGFASWDHTLSRYTLITTPHTTFAYHYTIPLQIARRR